jgi:hypothetical protein
MDGYPSLVAMYHKKKLEYTRVAMMRKDSDIAAAMTQCHDASVL